MSQVQHLPPPTIFIIGGTGAQGLPIISALTHDNKYRCRVLTRDPHSPRAKRLAALPNVELMTGSFASEPTLRAGFAGCHGAFVNLDGQNCGEKVEIYWAMRAYELALASKTIKFFLYGNIDFHHKLSGYDEACRCAHADGKGRVGEWILFQNQTNRDRMGAGLLTTGPYIDITLAPQAPMTVSLAGETDGVARWRMPLGADGAVPFVSLEDTGVYARWMFDHAQREASGLELKTAIAHIGFAELASAFERVTGHPARYVDTDLDEYWTTGPLSHRAKEPNAYNEDLEDPGSMDVKTNFTGWWETYRRSGGNKGVLTRDYDLLDAIFPGRIRDAEEWFGREDQRGRERGEGSLLERVQRGEMKAVMKIQDDGRKGAL